MSIRVLIADDQALFREGLETLLSVHQDIQVVGQASNGQEAVVTLIAASARCCAHGYADAGPERIRCNEAI